MERERTKRGLLCHIMTAFDPFGFVSPVMLKHKIFKRDTLPKKIEDGNDYGKLDWDDKLPDCIPLPGEVHSEGCRCGIERWNDILATLHTLDEIVVPRCVYTLGEIKEQRLFVFADASEIAISYSLYLRTVTVENEVSVTLLAGQSRVLPSGTSHKGVISISRAELCAADFLTKTSHQSEHDLKGHANLLPTEYFTDSVDVHDWLDNDKDKFSRFVTSRRDRILTLSKSSQWHWIPGKSKPADIGTRPVDVEQLKKSDWIAGPRFLQALHPEYPGTLLRRHLPKDLDIKGQTIRRVNIETTMDVMTGETWERIVSVRELDEHPVDITVWMTIIKQEQERLIPASWRRDKNTWNTSFLRQIAKFTPFFDNQNVLRGGGRIPRAFLTFVRKHPVLVPQTPIDDALIGYLHAKQALHQGRMITMSTMRNL